MPTVLLIEDDDDTRSAMSAVLARAGFSVIASDEGRKAMELAPFTRPSVVILDLATHGMNGHEFLLRRKDVPALADVPVVVVSASPGDAKGVEFALEKPVSPERLLEVVRALVERGSPGRPR